MLFVASTCFNFLGTFGKFFAHVLAFLFKLFQSNIHFNLYMLYFLISPAKFLRRFPLHNLIFKFINKHFCLISVHQHPIKLFGQLLYLLAVGIVDLLIIFHK